jgi:hypothetical protein
VIPRTLLASLVALLVAGPLLAQDKPADDMEIVREKMRADKKLLVSDAMGLTEAEAKGFWPVYESYQKDLGALNARMLKLIEDYAAHYETMDDAAARKLVDGYVAIERGAVIPETKVARYYQIENKIRAVVNYELASEIPLLK